MQGGRVSTGICFYFRCVIFLSRVHSDLAVNLSLPDSFKLSVSNILKCLDRICNIPPYVDIHGVLFFKIYEFCSLHQHSTPFSKILLFHLDTSVVLVSIVDEKSMAEDQYKRPDTNVLLRLLKWAYCAV